MLTPSLEDYLEELYLLSSSNLEIHSKDLAARLNVSMPSVTKALQRLNHDGYINYRAYGHIVITGKGKEIGQYLVERNQILKRFLTLLKADCDVEEEVESMEHYITPNVVKGIERLVRFLDSGSNLACLQDFLDLEERSQPSIPVNEIGDTRKLRRFGGKILPSV